MTITIDEINDIIKQAFDEAEKSLSVGDYQRAKNLYEQILRVSPDTDAAHLLSLVLHKLNENEASLNILNQYFHETDNWEIRNTFGVVLSSLNRHELAIEHLELAEKCTTKPEIVYNNIALAHRGLLNHDIEKKYLLKALNSNSTIPYLWFNLANAEMELGNSKAAIKSYQKAIDLEPDNASYHWNLANAYLSVGEYEKGWEEYEWRWKQFHAFDAIRQRFNKPLWQGEDLNNKTILLYCEQGAGDTVQFLRYISLLKSKGARVIFEWPIQSIRGDLTNLLWSFSDIDMVVDDDEVFNTEFDYHQSIMSLPFVMKTYSMLKTEPYIQPIEPELSPVLSEHLWESYKNKFKIGCVNAGSRLHPNDHIRSFDMSVFKVVEQLPNIQLFNLQKDHFPRKWKDGWIDLSDESLNIVDLSHYLFDFNSTAHAINQLDLILTVDTAVAHLAGAMGKNCILMVSHNPDWRWHQSQWYGSNFVIFKKAHWRQSWDELMIDVSNYIKKEYL